MQHDFDGWSDNIGINEMFNYCKNSDVEVMQYTGLYDKNGKEIYEGDILKSCPDSPKGIKFYYIVEWGHHAWAVRHYQANSRPSVTGNYFFAKSEIIGNIFQNPNLLNHGK